MRGAANIKTLLDTLRQQAGGAENMLTLDSGDLWQGYATSLCTRGFEERFSDGTKIICVATAHPSKFPEVITQSLELEGELPAMASHPSLERASRRCQHLRICDIDYLEEALVNAITARSDRS